MRRGDLLLVAGLFVGLVGCEDGRLSLGGPGDDCVYEWGRGPDVSFWSTSTIDYEPVSGPATVVSVDAWTVRLDEGTRFEIVRFTPDVPLGARVYVEYGDIHWFPLNGQGSRLAVYALAPGGTKGPLAVAIWRGAQPLATGDFGDLRYASVPTETPLCDDSCYDATSMAARFTFQGETVEVEGEGRIGPFLAHVAGVRRDVNFTCNFDSPTEYYEGLVARPGLEFEIEPTVDCPALGPDACLAEPACALFGGDGVGYRCDEARGACEALADPDACAAQDGCVWTPGDCYCPEGLDCDCADGAPPGCRTSCETWSPCPDVLRYCEGLTAADAACGPGPGWCALNGRSDCASEEAWVCTCQSVGGERRLGMFPSPCDRVEAGAPYVLTSSVCGL